MSYNQQNKHIYLSSIRELQASDAEENLKKKREMQQLFAESLRKQIEEKQQMKQNQLSKHKNIYQTSKNETKYHFTFGENDENGTVSNRSQSSLNQENHDLSFNMNIETFTINENKQPKPMKQLLSKADLSVFDHFKTNGQININDDSPFVSSTVPTPPQGFSIRNNQNNFKPISTLPINTKQIVNLEQNSRIDNYSKIPEWTKKNNFKNYRPPQTRSKSVLLKQMKNIIPETD